VIGIFSWAGFGFVAGCFTAWRMEGRDTGLILLTVAIGVIGSILGGFGASALGVGGMAVFSLLSIVFAALGAIFLLLGYRKVIGA
jgi:uncharacterized membrane protein YeaQ/YmgE (transglycosylase-associated protein family)